MSPYVPEECDTPESQRDYFDDLDRAIDEDEGRRPTKHELAAEAYEDRERVRRRRP
jgi:hypothetical protein